MLDLIDAKILTCLQDDGRLTNQELAERVGLSPSPCLRRVRRLEREGVIKRYAAVVDQRQVGLPVSVFVSIEVRSVVPTKEKEIHTETRGYPSTHKSMVLYEYLSFATHCFTPKSILQV